jgi:radical SAM protein with 4Fe4S-binding SPASM domain
VHCPKPFHQIEIKANGNVYCCCEGWLPKPLGNVLETPLIEIWQGASARDIRSSIFDGSFRYCTACPYLPGPGGPVIDTSPLRPAANKIHTIKLDYDQTCQLKCPSCRTDHSRYFVDEAKTKRIHEAVMTSGVLEITDQVYVTGAGDPFASPLYWNFLKTLHVPQNPNLKIFLHTNGLLLDEQHWNELGDNQDRVSEIGISIDAATPMTYQINRGGSWSKLWSNIEFVNRLQKSGKTIMLGMFYTVQANNFRELMAFLQLAFAHKAAWISITALRNWGTYTSDDYQQRAVHLPSHPDYAEFRRVITDSSITQNPKIVLDSFNPDHAIQKVASNPGALLPESRLTRKP